MRSTYLSEATVNGWSLWPATAMSVANAFWELCNMQGTEGNCAIALVNFIRFSLNW